MSGVITVAQSRLLFAALWANGAFSLFSGLILTLGAAPVADWIGVTHPGMLVVTGLVLTVFGASLVWRASRKRIRRADAIVISAMDLGWVAGSIGLLLAVPGLFSAAGAASLIVVAVIVSAFFDVQAYALWKTRA